MMIRSKELCLVMLQLCIVVLLIKTVQVQARCSDEFPCNNMINEEGHSMVFSDMSLDKERSGLRPWVEKRVRRTNRLYSIDFPDNKIQPAEILYERKKGFNPWGGKRDVSNSNSIPIDILKEQMKSNPELRNKIREYYRKRNFSPWGGK
ncbi:Hypothetical predicted protein [Octopus vulgaris]|uniref:Uncharacterized protein n=2 Tax=Octopus TaxID=6643 RepID=A0AA36F1L7_OCTVU|nr:uncharacterized protein LOC115210327 [Octopus sinensis]CAI9722286.1 Hypothetical predicted protein [Octopus vulgaris]